MVREAKYDDLYGLLEVYLYLHEKSIPEPSDHLSNIWKQIMEDPNHHLIVNEVDGVIVSTCDCVIIPNLTRGLRPHAFVENVVTHTESALKWPKRSQWTKTVIKSCWLRAPMIRQSTAFMKTQAITAATKPHMFSGSDTLA